MLISQSLSRTDSKSFRLIHQLTIDYDVEHIDGLGFRHSFAIEMLRAFLNASDDVVILVHQPWAYPNDDFRDDVRGKGSFRRSKNLDQKPDQLAGTIAIIAGETRRSAGRKRLDFPAFPLGLKTDYSPLPYSFHTFFVVCSLLFLIIANLFFAGPINMNRGGMSRQKIKIADP